MQPAQPIFTSALFPRLHALLIDLLRGLSAPDWHRPTVCAGWSVKDIAAHLLDTNFRRIAQHRDDYVDPTDQPAIDSYGALVRYLNRLNHDWVVATRRLSPAILIDLLEQTGPYAYALYKTLPPFEAARFSVAWAGDATSPNWFHIAREYTEWWHHQQQIRLAVDQTAPLMTRELYHPLLDTFMRALPHTYRNVVAPVGTLIAFVITGEGGGTWYVYRNDAGWQLVTGADPKGAHTAVTIDGAIAWRLFTRSLPAAETPHYVRVAGDPALANPVLSMTAVMA